MTYKLFVLMILFFVSAIATIVVLRGVESPVGHTVACVEEYLPPTSCSSGRIAYTVEDGCRQYTCLDPLCPTVGACGTYRTTIDGCLESVCTDTGIRIQGRVVA